MNRKKEKSKIWLVLFYSCFAVVVIAAGILFKNYIDSQAANGQFDNMQAGVNGEAENNAVEGFKEIDISGTTDIDASGIEVSDMENRR